MGGIVWSDWARLVCLCASFVIFVGGCMGTFQPLPAFELLWKLKVLYNPPLPILPVILIVLGIMVYAIEYPLVAVEYFKTPDSIMPKVAFYIPVAVFSLLEAQTVNGGVYLAIGTVAYLMAIRADFLKHQASAWGRLP